MVPFFLVYGLESYKVIPKRNYLGAYGQGSYGRFQVSGLSDFRINGFRLRRIGEGLGLRR